ncbi:polyketide cyclase [Prevotella sp. AGR2160]|uniref:polyketide cyclase n=1 Tax=Prevotella sp. AGR2160 TaxID=1280674 RepID=UPI000414C44E|nr:polyketide cyclase [Prevotella sp. AGR2160]
MTTFESPIKVIAAPQERVYAMLSDLSNIEKVRDRIPEDKAKGLSFDADSMSIDSPAGAITLRIVNREAPKMIKFETAQSPLPFNFWIQLLPVTTESCKMKLTIKAELNPFIKGMVSKPLQEALDKIAEAIAGIPF